MAINKASIILILNLINSIISPINNIGVVITKQAYILDIIIVLGFIGRVFNMFMFLPSRLITEFVIDVIYEVITINISIITEVLFIINSMLKPKPFSLLVRNCIALSNLATT